MRLSELMGKKIINIYNGEIMGTVGDSDLLVDEKTGEIRALVLPRRRERGLARRDLGELTVPWEAICKIGAEIIVVDVETV
jgi:YlmC/YmxH family sporulation protein